MSLGTSPRWSRRAVCVVPRELGAFYESLLGFRAPVIEPRTVEMMTKVHRWGLRDALFAFDAPWGLGVGVDFSGGTGRRAFGHGGMASSRGVADPECGLVDGDRRERACRVLRRRATRVRDHRRGLPRPRGRHRAPASTDNVVVSTTVAVDLNVARDRGAHPSAAAMSSRIRGWISGGPATTSPDVSHARSSPLQSVTTPPASRTITPPAATSHVPSCCSK